MATIDPETGEYQRRRKRINRRPCRERRHIPPHLFSTYDCCRHIAWSGRDKNGGMLIFYGSIRMVAEETHCPPATAARNLRELRKLGWLLFLKPQPGGRWRFEIDCTDDRVDPDSPDGISFSLYPNRPFRYQVLTHDEWLAADSSRTCPMVAGKRPKLWE